MRAVEALQGFARQHGIAEKELFALCLALEECGSNIVNHALRRDAQQTFEVAFHHTGHSFTIELRDRGPAFDPTGAAPRKPEADEDDLPGGWGIQLVHRYIDQIHYARENDENVLRLTKQLTERNGQ